MQSLLKQPKTHSSLLVYTLTNLDSCLPATQIQLSPWHTLTTEESQVDWLILHFNHWFSHHNVKLIKGEYEPEYFPAQNQTPARIQFAHGFFNSALHEISHWTIAGKHRRTLPDLGYWYAPDGRTKEQQAIFEQVEIKPQAIEWLFAKAFGRQFRVSLDNLTGDAGDSRHFKDNVYQQVESLFLGKTKLPQDAAYFIHYICQSTRNGQLISFDEFQREELD
ncbi:elongation factor P hydroxylase [Acinetobacter nectaris]|uniref:elongation factor P hydroxylase n=1 Tax=Acinetobacter nectaris TaxID=1219382 RepID=UPI001F2F6691|nr:elongation factor P hydroxylase [Acinetobacter nectaris]MCF9033954.1 elongation factor P hydroxylase [Acinetobacter nectaris]